ncbi:MAG: hypothetical protein U0166_08275 [Acidobacteriota bacterium]
MFDLVLGGGTLLRPDLYLRLMQPGLVPRSDLLPRTAAIWLVFGVVEAAAAIRPSRGLVVAVAAYRLMDVPADLVYRFTAEGLGAFGSTVLILAPAVNLAVGMLLCRAATVVFAWVGARSGTDAHQEDGPRRTPSAGWRPWYRRLR